MKFLKISALAIVLVTVINFASWLIFSKSTFMDVCAVELRQRTGSSIEVLENYTGRVPVDVYEQLLNRLETEKKVTRIPIPEGGTILDVPLSGATQLTINKYLLRPMTARFGFALTVSPTGGTSREYFYVWLGWRWVRVPQLDKVLVS